MTRGLMQSVAALLLLAACNQIDLSELQNTSLCSDDFNRADSNSLGSTWEFNGLSGTPTSYGISGQKASVNLQNSGFGLFSCSTRVDRPKTVISAKFSSSISVTGTLALIGRSQAKGTLSDAYYCGIESGKLSLYKGVKAQRTNLSISSTTLTITPGIEYQLSFSLFEGELTCNISGLVNDSVSASDSSFTAGYTGFAAITSGNAQFKFDDFKTEVRP